MERRWAQVPMASRPTQVAVASHAMERRWVQVPTESRWIQVPEVTRV